jgi:hypothetical protein
VSLKGHLRSVTGTVFGRSVILAAMKIGAVALLLCLWTGSTLIAQTHNAVSLVNPLIGTQRSAIGYGGTMPFVAPPFAMKMNHGSA